MITGVFYWLIYKSSKLIWKNISREQIDMDVCLFISDIAWLFLKGINKTQMEN